MEYVDKFDNKRRKINKVTERYDEISGEYRQSMHIWIQNSKKEFLIQKRAKTKKIYPGMWATTGGGVDKGETTLDTVVRELKEELGIDVNLQNVELILSFKRDYDFVDVYLLKMDIDLHNIVMQEEELDEVKWVNEEELKNLWENGLFTDSNMFYYDFLKKVIQSY